MTVQDPGTDDGHRHSTPGGFLAGLMVLAASGVVVAWILWLVGKMLEASDSGGLLWLAAILVALPFWAALLREEHKERDRELFRRGR